MILEKNQMELLHRLTENWPSNFMVTLVEGRIANIEQHPLSGELAAFEVGGTVSLPFFATNESEVRWFTAGRCAEDLRVAIDQLRCWIIPSFGWEEPLQPLVIPSNASGLLGRLIVSMYPGGYFRWRTRIQSDCVQIVADRLKSIRKLDSLKPEHVFDRIPSLFELRQQYAIALATGDRDSALEAIRTIDHHQLDTAVNTTFMQIRFWDKFREYSEIVNNSVVLELVSVRIPRSIRLNILKAYHAVFLAEIEMAGDVERTAQLYEKCVHPVLAGLIRTLSPNDNPEARRCLGYLAWHEKDIDLARQVLKDQNDPFLATLFKEILFQESMQGSGFNGTAESFKSVQHWGDWEDIQNKGMQLFRANPEDVPIDLKKAILPVLLESLNHLPNQELQRALSAQIPTIGEVTVSSLQSWAESLQAISNRRWGKVRHFLSAETRPSLAEIDLYEISRALNFLEELLTDPVLVNESGGTEVANELLASFIEDFVQQEFFPEDRFTLVYQKLLHIWVDHKIGSARSPDGQLLLALAHAVLSCRGDEDGEIGNAIRRWWQGRRVRVLVPFLIEALELLINYTLNMGFCETLWIELADLVRRDSNAYTPGEKNLIRQIGKSLNLDTKTIDEFLGAKIAGEAIEEVDILSTAGLKKVAIVSLHEKAALLAGKIINERINVPVVLVTEKDAGDQVNNAKNADVILFVWSASKHAVYRAFDNVREKLAYVQGVGSSSIVLALERWALKNSPSRS